MRVNRGALLRLSSTHSDYYGCFLSSYHLSGKSFQKLAIGLPLHREGKLAYPHLHVVRTVSTPERVERTGRVLWNILQFSFMLFIVAFGIGDGGLWRL